MQTSCKRKDCGHALDAHFPIPGGLQCRECAGDIMHGDPPLCPLPLPPKKRAPARRKTGGARKRSSRRG